MLYDGGSFLADINQGSSGDDGSGSIDATFAPGAVATGDPHLRPAVWFNLDGPSAMVALKVGRGRHKWGAGCQRHEQCKLLRY